MLSARLLPIAACAAWGALAQDPFEIHVYEYEPMPLGEYSLELHLNFVTQGNALRDGTLLPTQYQTHLTLEPTVGLSENFAIGFMFLNAWEPGFAPQFAGWRVLPHLYAPETWHLPVRVGFVAEFSFQNVRYEENSRRAELRPILDREFARWQIVLNPVFERASSTANLRAGRLCSILFSSAPCTGPARRTDGTLSPPCYFAGSARPLRLLSNTMERSRALTSARALSRRCTNSSPGAIGK